ncbi:MAG TPA: ABC transporter permease [Flavipsychrobacter sp.]|nr:ABC transporter permease [Flavipsychrobacter sp.]
MNNTETIKGWDIVIEPKNSLFSLNLKDVWRYRDLLQLLVKRDFISIYKQTILGPLWFFIQPLLTTAMYLLIFNKVANLSTDDVPPLLFYLAGITCWNYFSETLTKTSDTFITNASIFGKVYFPRLIIPLSIVFSSLIRLVIQFALFMIFWVYYIYQGAVQPNMYVLLFPVLLLMMAALGLGLGIIFSSLTTKYRDLRFLLSFGIQLLMFATPVVYPLSLAPEKYKWLIVANPFTAIIETFRYGFLGKGELNWMYLTYSAAATFIILIIGILLFNKVEKNFMDTV